MDDQLAALRESKVKTWLTEVRAPFFTATIVPIILGATIAWARTGTFHLGLFLLAMLGGLLLHTGTNVANDYFDHRSGTDDLNVEFVRPFTGGSRMIQAGLLTPKEVISGALAAFALACVVGLILAYVRGPLIIVLGLVGIFSGFFYTAPPFNLVSKGIGEFFIGLNFGVLMTLGSFFVQTGYLAWEPVVAAIPVGLLIAGVLYINEFQDAPADGAVGKDHLVVRLGRRKAALGYLALIVATYAVIVLAVLLRITSPFTLIALATLPVAIRAIGVARAHYDEYLQLVPANAATVFIHLLTGLLLSAGYLLDKAVQPFI
ncbi:MAG TPA: 1,4-dihydroxy-2-naphthoate octaprenyltransferase [Chloroflexi bacterium]|nr:1,4-dihydroxy-2-naphthoate octaprenyltransferase [Chloroflexota bacterium]